MEIVPVSFNGTSLQSTDFIASYPESNAPLSPTVNPQYVKRAGAFPIISGSDFNSTTIGIEVECLGSFMDTFETLVKVFNVEDETPRALVIQDAGDSNKQYTIYAIPRAVVGGSDGAMARVTLSLDSPIWQSVTQNSQTFSTTSATDSTSINNVGNADAYPIFEITPSSQPSSDYLYNRFLQVIPTSTDAWTNRFLDVLGTTDGTGLDTAALVAGGKMLASGNDLRLFRDGVEIDRQLSGINTTDTHVICVVDMPGAITMTLGTAIASTDTVTEMVIANTVTNKPLMSLMKNTGRLIVDSGLGTTDTEEFTYTAKTVTATKLSFTINARAVRGTTAVAHAVGSSVRLLPYDFNILYGNPSADAPTIDETRKPIQDLTSRNNSFVYTNFYDEAGLRSGIFKPIPSKVSDVNLTNSGVYTSTNDEGDTDPATSMGMKALTYLKLGVSKSDSVILGWQNYFPDLIASVSSVTGEQSQSSAVFPTLSLQSSAAAATTSFTNLFTVSAQTSTDYGTFTTWTKASSDAVVGANKRYLRWLQSGAISGTITTYSKAAISAITVGLTNTPNIQIRTENNNYNLNCIITNETTGDLFYVNLPMELNETLYIDTNPDFPTARYKGQIVNGAIKLSSVRSAWLKLQSGTNTIGYESTPSDAFDISIVIKWYDRMRFL